MGKEVLVEGHGAAIGGPKIGPEQEEGEIQRPGVNPRMPPLARWGPVPGVGLSQVQTDLKHLSKTELPTDRDLLSCPPSFSKTSPRQFVNKRHLFYTTKCAPQAEPPGRLTVGRGYPSLGTEEG